MTRSGASPILLRRGDKGAGQFTATALVNGVTLTGTLNYEVIAGAIRIGFFDDKL